MQYETIILELLSRIKVLEEEVAAIKQTLEAAAAADQEAPVNTEPQGSPSASPTVYKKMTDEMIMLCYQCGKKLHDGENLTDLVDSIENETGMNRNSAIMYLYAVSAMLGGNIYKRAISTKATELYYERIFNEYGSSGLKKALQATSLHIDYRKDCGHTVDSIEALYEQYMQRL